eukprot:1198505-Lingulodinium_polyedra.AAC.1
MDGTLQGLMNETRQMAGTIDVNDVEVKQRIDTAFQAVEARLNVVGTEIEQIKAEEGKMMAKRSNWESK